MNATTAVRVLMVNAKDEVVAKEREFKTTAAANRWVDQLDAKGSLVRVLCWSA